MWRRCCDILVWIDHSDVLWFQKNVLVLPEPYWRYMHEAKMCTHATHALILSHAHPGTRADAILYQDPPHVII